MQINSAYFISTLIDNLTYSYSGNKLVQVEDASTNPAGFTNGASAGDEMGYDANGNLTKDDNRGITLTYNPLNLIAQAKKGTNTLSYVYNAAGSKLQLMSPNTTTTYAGDFEYDGSGNLKRIAIEEGQLVMASDSFRVEYFLRDHLGNVRMVLGENNQVKQVTDYHAFGKAVDRTGNKNSNPYRYNGKEEQDETGFLDYGARQYDATLGRWMSIDPLSEKMKRFSPFAYGFDNPMRFIDPDGNAPVDWIKLKNGSLRYDPSINNQLAASLKYGSGSINLGKSSLLMSKSGRQRNLNEDGSITTATILSAVTIKGKANKTEDKTEIDNALKVNDAVGLSNDIHSQVVDLAKSIDKLEQASEGFKAVGGALDIVGKVTGFTGAVTSAVDAYKNPTSANILKASFDAGLFAVGIFAPEALLAKPIVGIADGVLDAVGAKDAIFDTLGNKIDQFIDNKQRKDLEIYKK